MGSEYLLYIYGVICTCMIFFNIVYNMIMNGRDHKLRENIEKYDMLIGSALNEIREGRKLPRSHYRRMERVLSSTLGLMAVEAALGRHVEYGNEAAVEYLKSLGPIFIRLAKKYEKRESLQAAYFAYFIGDEKFKGCLPADELQRILIDYAAKDCFYCRVNAMRALYSFGDAQSIADAVTICDRKDAFFHAKVLQDGLLTYHGDSDALIEILLKRFNSFKEATQVALLNYIRFESDKYSDIMLDILKDESRNKELRLAAIRYLGKYPNEGARELLKKFASDKNTVNWDFTAVSVLALARYEGQDVTDVLIEAMLSTNWHVRNNSSMSLKMRGVSYTDIPDSIRMDRYTDEMLRYRLKDGNDDTVEAVS